MAGPAASAQDPEAPTRLVVEEIRSGFVVAPDLNPAWDGSPWPGSVAFRYREDFLVADPQLSVHLNVTDWLRIGGGAGYRFIGHAGPAGERLQGLTASIGLQLGPP